MSACAEREPFTPSFVSSWDGSWGANDFCVVAEDGQTGCAYEFGEPGAQFLYRR
jgi:hypothetical protein